MRRRDFLKSSLCVLPATWLLCQTKKPKETVTLRAYPEGWLRPIKVANDADLKIGDLIELAAIKYTVIMIDNQERTCWLDRPLEEPCEKHAPLKLVEHHESLLAKSIWYNEMLKPEIIKLVSRPLGAL